MKPAVTSESLDLSVLQDTSYWLPKHKFNSLKLSTLYFCLYIVLLLLCLVVRFNAVFLANAYSLLTVSHKTPPWTCQHNTPLPFLLHCATLLFSFTFCSGLDFFWVYQLNHNPAFLCSTPDYSNLQSTHKWKRMQNHSQNTTLCTSKNQLQVSAI